MRARLFLLLFMVLPFAASAAPMPEVGHQAPSFSLPSQDGKMITLQQFHGKWVILYFYPRDFTHGCTIEAHNFQEDSEKYRKLNAAIIGVSLDSAASHKEFCAKEGLNFKLLSDSDHKVADEYGVVIMNRGGKTVASRTSFLIDPAGIIRKVYPKVDPAGHSAEVLADIAKLSGVRTK